MIWHFLERVYFLICCLYRPLFLMSTKENRLFTTIRKNTEPSLVYFFFFFFWSVFVVKTCWANLVCVLSIFHSLYLHSHSFPKLLSFFPFGPVRPLEASGPDGSDRLPGLVRVCTSAFHQWRLFHLLASGTLDCLPTNHGGHRGVLFVETLTR